MGQSSSRPEQNRRVIHTETMNIMASCSLDSSLHAAVSSGFPVATKSKPGGGFLSVVICSQDDERTGQDIPHTGKRHSPWEVMNQVVVVNQLGMYLELQFFLLFGIFDRFKICLVFHFGRFL